MHTTPSVRFNEVKEEEGEEEENENDEEQPLTPRRKHNSLKHYPNLMNLHEALETQHPQNELDQQEGGEGEIVNENDHHHHHQRYRERKGSDTMGWDFSPSLSHSDVLEMKERIVEASRELSDISDKYSNDQRNVSVISQELESLLFAKTTMVSQLELMVRRHSQFMILCPEDQIQEATNYFDEEEEELIEMREQEKRAEREASREPVVVDADEEEEKEEEPSRKVYFPKLQRFLDRRRREQDGALSPNTRKRIDKERKNDTNFDKMVRESTSKRRNRRRSSSYVRKFSLFQNKGADEEDVYLQSLSGEGSKSPPSLPPPSVFDEVEFRKLSKDIMSFQTHISQLESEISSTRHQLAQALGSLDNSSVMLEEGLLLKRRLCDQLWKIVYFKENTKVSLEELSVRDQDPFPSPYLPDSPS